MQPLQHPSNVIASRMEAAELYTALYASSKWPCAHGAEQLIATNLHGSNTQRGQYAFTHSCSASCRAPSRYSIKAKAEPKLSGT